METLQPHCWQWEVMAQLVHILMDQETGMGQEVEQGYNAQGPSPRSMCTN